MSLKRPIVRIDPRKRSKTLRVSWETLASCDIAIGRSMEKILAIAGKKAERSHRQQWVWWHNGRYHVTRAFRKREGVKLVARAFAVGDVLRHGD